MPARSLTESEAFQQYLAEQLANGGRRRSPEQLLRAWRAEQRGRSVSPRKRTKSPKTATTKASPLRHESELGKTLRQIRERYIAEGGKLLSMEEIDRRRNS